MSALFFLIAPIAGLVIVGYAARATGLVGERTGEGLSDFVFTLAVPCLLFRTLARANLPDLWPWGYWGAYFAAVALVWALAMGLARRGFGRSDAAALTCGFTAAQSNTVMVGIPLIVQAAGNAGAVPMALLLAVHLPITMTAATVLAEGRQTRPLVLAKRLITHPILAAIGMGIVLRPVIGQIPAPVWAIIDALASTAVPCALAGLGIALHRHGLKAAMGLPIWLSAMKLVVHPGLVLLLAVHVMKIDPLWTAVAVLFAACPCGINAHLFAERYRAGTADASGAIALSTLLSAGSLLGWLAALGWLGLLAPPG